MPSYRKSWRHCSNKSWHISRSVATSNTPFQARPNSGLHLLLISLGPPVTADVGLPRSVVAHPAREVVYANVVVSPDTVTASTICSMPGQFCPIWCRVVSPPGAIPASVPSPAVERRLGSGLLVFAIFHSRPRSLLRRSLRPVTVRIRTRYCGSSRAPETGGRAGKGLPRTLRRGPSYRPFSPP